MQYIKYTIRTIPEAEDMIISELSELGLCGAQIEDHVPLTAAEKEQIYTYDADDPEDDGIAHVSFYAAVCEDGRISLSGDPEVPAEERRESSALEEEIREALSLLSAFMDIGDGTLSVSITDDAEWKDKWKQYFRSFRIDDIFITPSWEAEETLREETAPRYTLRIDPGTAFGTGAHETTQLAIRAVRAETDRRLREAADREASCAGAYPERISVLDIGTGSGILSILALMFGADFAVGTDLDVFTKEATAENLAVNGMDSSRFRLVIGNLIDDERTQEEVLRLSAGRSSPGEEDDAAGKGYDIVIANILPVVLTPLTPVVPRFLKKGAVYITSGILREKEEEMRTVLEKAGFETVDVTYQGEWCCLKSRLS
ncbi:MAG: 50S ribosomal protein L11 methyltransferase [Lachnospiraceae bacterium]|nr:50S ribosomal protein L11 methyltransferase [Lachnospiraceae bacterium]